MKKITMAFALIVATMATSCQKDDVSGSTTPEQQADAAYVSLTVDTSSTRAATSEDDDGTTSVGSEEENKIFSLALLTFDNNYDYIGSHQVYLTDGKFNCEVAPDARRFFAVVNPTEDIWTAIKAVSSFNQSAFSSLPAIAMTAASVSTENYQGGSASNETRGFTMVNCGSKNSSGILLESLVSVTTELSVDVENPTSITIAVDRLVSKFEFSVSKSFDSNTASKFETNDDDVSPVGEVLGVALTATNKATYLYSMILTDQLTNKRVYRTDHNMSVGQLLSEPEDIVEELEANFYWLKNNDEATDNAFIAPNSTAGSVATTPEYVLENTVEPSYSNSNNLTQAIVKATYNPTMTSGDVLSLGTSWFKMYTTTGDGTLYLTFDEVQDLYNGKEVYGFIAPTTIQNAMSAQLNNIMGSNEKSWATVTLAELDARPYGGYKAATVASESDYVLQYYQKAVNYYDIFIQHDDAQEVGHTGRWGMVRNNSYTMDITGIMQEGLPYIPDPTDPEIVDPENQDPTDPEPADKLETHIAVTISVNPWVLWYQESPLM